MGSSDGRPDLLGNVAVNLAVCPRAAPMSNAQGPAIFLDFFARTLAFARLPRLSRHLLAAAAIVNGKKQKWEWIQENVKEGVRNPAWYRGGLADEIGVIFVQLFYRAGDWRRTVHFAPKMGYGYHELWRVVWGRRIQVKGWTMGSPHLGRRAFWVVAPRNTDRTWRRWR